MDSQSLSFQFSYIRAILRLQRDNMCCYGAWPKGVSPQTPAPFLPLSCVSSWDPACLFSQLLKAKEKGLICRPGLHPEGQKTYALWNWKRREAIGHGVCLYVHVRACLCAQCVRALGQAVETQHPPRPRPTQSCCSKERATFSHPVRAGRERCGCEGPASH